MHLRNDRKNRRKYSLKYVVVFWVGCLLIAFLASVGFFLFRKYKSIIYVSPVPKQSQEQTNDINTLKSLLLEKNIAFSLVSSWDSSSYLIKLVSGEEIVITAKKSLVDQVSSLQLVLSRLTIEGKRVSRIDFRFDTPVLTEQ